MMMEKPGIKVNYMPAEAGSFRGQGFEGSSENPFKVFLSIEKGNDLSCGFQPNCAFLSLW